MAKTSGPLYSFGASGQFAKSMIFMRNGYVRPYVPPALPPTETQAEKRFVFGLATQILGQLNSNAVAIFSANCPDGVGWKSHTVERLFDYFDESANLYTFSTPTVQAGIMASWDFVLSACPLARNPLLSDRFGPLAFSLFMLYRKLTNLSSVYDEYVTSLDEWLNRLFSPDYWVIPHLPPASSVMANLANVTPGYLLPNPQLFLRLFTGEGSGISFYAVVRSTSTSGERFPIISSADLNTSQSLEFDLFHMPDLGNILYTQVRAASGVYTVSSPQNSFAANRTHVVSYHYKYADSQGADRVVMLDDETVGAKLSYEQSSVSEVRNIAIGATAGYSFAGPPYFQGSIYRILFFDEKHQHSQRLQIYGLLKADPFATVTD